MRHTIPNNAAASTRTPITLGGYDFRFVATLAPERAASGLISEWSPQALYKNLDTYPLHKHGLGTFCKFRIVVPKDLVGVYSLIVDGEVRYVGECADLGKRFNMGYGNISPKNCYVGGQSTNCKINRRVLDIAKAEGQVDLYVYPTLERKTVEKELVGMYVPPWNG